MDNIELSTSNSKTVIQGDDVLFDSNTIENGLETGNFMNVELTPIDIPTENGSSSSSSSSNNVTEDTNTTIVIDNENTNNTDPSLSNNNNNSTIDAGEVGDNFLLVNTYQGGSEQDSYQFEVTQTGTYEVELGELSANLDLSIGDGEGNIIYSSEESGNESESITAEFEAGNYTAYITAGAEGAETDYSFTITKSSEDNSSPPDDNNSGSDGGDNEPIIGEGDIVYRFFETNGQTQFYTTSDVERDSVIENLSNYEYEGESFIGAPNPNDDDITGVVAVYRFYNNDTGVHLYTASQVEQEFVTENLANYIDEGISYYGYESQQEGSVPLYRFYNQSLDAHFYTPSIEERDEFLADSAYQPEGSEDGIAFYVAPAADI